MRSDMNSNASLSLKSINKKKKKMLYLNLEVTGLGRKFVSIGTLEVPCADRHSKSIEWSFWVPGPRLRFGPIWTSFLRIF